MDKKLWFIDKVLRFNISIVSVNQNFFKWLKACQQKDLLAITSDHLHLPSIHITGE